MKIFRWIGSNLTSLILSLLLALVIWISAVTSANPNTEAEFTLPLEVVQQASDIAIVDEIPENVSVTLLAPESIIQQLEEDNPLVATINLSEITAGTYRFPVQITIPDQINPVRVLEQNPKQLELRVSNLVSKSLTIVIQVEGGTVSVTGPEGKVKDVDSVVGVLDISDATGTISRTVSLQARNAAGEAVTGVNLEPANVDVNQTISLQGGYRNLAVNVTTIGSVEPGYRFTSITPAPPTVMVFSADPQLVEGLPGYVNTKPLDLTGVDDYLETILELDLPQGVTVVGDPTVLVQVNVTALETNMIVTRDIEVIGLLPGLTAQVSPEEVSLSISGPVPVLDNLTLRDIRVVADLTDLPVGTHNITPTIEILPSNVVWEDVSPATVEVVIQEGSSTP
ncbi:MAG: CdaR family protein [Anaerolineales bacterium]